MNECDAIEQAYKNGYKDGYEEGKRDTIGEAVWIINSDGYYPYCSNCYYEPEKPLSNTDNRTPHCPNCGFRMRKEIER